ncbi:DUF2218 domain-containing protein [Kutzneria chonburiensis]|jgi:hypothetical protein|uniref:DUF2218 domain-containing protein n=1 Tax=Kutzneria chonburiensis TaxID=1483604 RepID=A0ABV6MY94_9PSEU|nr:DUF2218 domain-containing protein [Kutzneria chonburiensis]
MTGSSFTTQALVATDRPSRYLVQLCKHFGHKIQTVWTEHEGELYFDFGTAVLRTRPEGLHITCTTGDAEALDRLADVVERHLVRFGAKDELVVAWSSTGQAA